MSVQESHLGGGRIQEVLRLLGQELSSDVEILIVGGAAALLTGLLPAVVTTEDVDFMHVRPSAEVDAVLLAAETVADRAGIVRGWLNLDAGLYAFALPAGWEGRRVDLGKFGRLRVWSIGRVSIGSAMKFFAHRSTDLGHLLRLSISRKELDDVAEYLKNLADDVPSERSGVERALRLVSEWAVGS